MAFEPITVEQCVDSAREALASADLHFGHGCETAHDEAVWTVLHVSDLMDFDYPEAGRRSVSKTQLDRINQLIDARIATRKPLAYLINQAWFAGRAFYIDERAIIPRSHIGDLIQDGFGPMVPKAGLRSVLDLCAGSGCIAVALALQYPEADVLAADIDDSALQVAAINIDRFEVANRVRTVRSDLFSSLAGQSYDLIACNPPYVDADSIDSLPEEYLHEPRLAFAAAESGIAIIRKILVQAPDYLNDEGCLVLEAGDSAEVLEQRFPQVPFFWLTSRSGQSVVLLANKSELLANREHFANSA